MSLYMPKKMWLLREWWLGSPHFYLRHQLENRQIYAPAPLVWREFAGYSLNRKLGGTYSRPGCFDENFLPCRQWDQDKQYLEARN